MADQTRQKNAWPLIFTYRGNVFGHRYIAYVSAVSRVLGIQEDDGIWLSGVQPGGVAAGGTNVREACEAYRKAFVGVLADIASSAGDFAALKTEAARMLADRDDTAFEDWTGAWRTTAGTRLGRTQMQQLPVKPAAMTPSLTATLESERRSVGVEGAPGKEEGDERSWQWPMEQYTWRLLSCRT